MAIGYSIIIYQNKDVDCINDLINYFNKNHFVTANNKNNYLVINDNGDEREVEKKHLFEILEKETHITLKILFESGSYINCILYYNQEDIVEHYDFDQIKQEETSTISSILKNRFIEKVIKKNAVGFVVDFNGYLEEEVDWLELFNEDIHDRITFDYHPLVIGFKNNLASRIIAKRKPENVKTIENFILFEWY